MSSAETAWMSLDPPMRLALELAWQSARAGSLGIGAVITDDHDATVATGRNRLREQDAGDDHLAGTSLAHAEMNALAKLPWRGHAGERLTLWTTLEPCLMCTGAIRMAPIAEVRYLAPDPLFTGAQDARHLNDFIGSNWPDVHGPMVDPLAVAGILFPAHAGALWGATAPLWASGLPAITSLAGALAASGELTDAAGRGTAIDALLHQLYDRLVVAAADFARYVPA